MTVPKLRWAVLICDLDPTVGHEQAGERRALIVSYEPFHRSGLMTICPITAARAEALYPGEVSIPKGEAGQTKAGVILCHQVRTVSILRAQSTLTSGKIGYVNDDTLRTKVRSALAVQLGLDIPGMDDGAKVDAYFGDHEA